MIGNEEDFTACLGFEVKGGDRHLSELNIDAYAEMTAEAMKEYPNFRLIATTLRTVKSASKNDWSAICRVGDEVYKGIYLEDLEIFDRVGGGDSFASGLIYGLINNYEPQKALNYGIAHGALAMTTPGDTSMANLKEVENIVKGGGARVER
jgi:2-dehydro-3-deoxygluconokinase